MRKNIANVLILVLLSFLIGCGEKSVNKSTYSVGIDTSGPPMGYKDPKTGELTGYEHDILVEIAKRGGFTLNFQEMIFSNILPKIQEKTLDIGMGAYSITEERKKIVNFSEYHLTQDVVVLANNDNKDINEKDVLYGVEKGTYFKTLIKDGNITEDVSKDKIIEKLLAKEVDYVIFDKPIAVQYIEKYPQLYEKEILKRAYIGFPISKELGNEFNEKINKIIIEMKKDGTIDNLKKKYNIVE